MKNELPNPNVYGTIDGLKTHPLWRQLTKKQQAFVEAYIRLDGDKLAAVKAAYVVNSDNSANTMAHKLVKQYAIRTLLGAHYGYTIQAPKITRRELMVMISERMRTATDSEFRALSSIYADLRGWRPRVTKPRKMREEDSGQEPEKLSARQELFKLIREYERTGNEED